METLQATQSTARAGRAFRLKWVLANAAASAVSAVVTIEIANRGLVIWFGIPGAVLAGMMHWLVLRRQVGWAGSWWLATSVGWLVGISLGPYAAFVIGTDGYMLPVSPEWSAMTWIT